jgi:hypothetical protein
MNPPVVAVIDDGIAVHDCIPDPVMNIEINDDGSVSEYTCFLFQPQHNMCGHYPGADPGCKKRLDFPYFPASC